SVPSVVVPFAELFALTVTPSAEPSADAAGVESATRTRGTLLPEKIKICGGITVGCPIGTGPAAEVFWDAKSSPSARPTRAPDSGWVPIRPVAVGGGMVGL